MPDASLADRIETALLEVAETHPHLVPNPSHHWTANEVIALQGTPAYQVVKAAWAARRIGNQLYPGAQRVTEAALTAHTEKES